MRKMKRKEITRKRICAENQRRKGDIMKKVYKLDEIDCANCARKLEDAINKLDGVVAAEVNFLTQKLTLEAADERFEEVLAAVKKTMKKLEPDCRLVG